jgi:hypothetical protein
VLFSLSAAKRRALHPISSPSRARGAYQLHTCPRLATFHTFTPIIYIIYAGTRAHVPRLGLLVSGARFQDQRANYQRRARYRLGASLSAGGHAISCTRMQQRPRLGISQQRRRCIIIPSGPNVNASTWAPRRNVGTLSGSGTL